MMDYMPYIVAVILILAALQALTTIAQSYFSYHEKMDMLKHGFVPKDYQPLPQSDTAGSRTKSEQPAALPPAPWGAQQWQEGVPTSRYMGELAKDDSSTR